MGTSSSSIGLRHVRVAVRDTDGTLKIQGNPAATVAYSGEQIGGAQALTIVIPDPQRVTVRGDDRPYHTWQLPPTENPTGELRVSKTNFDAIALITSTSEFGSADARRLGWATDKQGDEEDLILWGCQEAIDSDEDSADFAEKRWLTYLLPNCKASIKPAAMEDATPGVFVYSIAANQSARDEFGKAFTIGTHGFTKAAILPILTKYKFMLDVFKGNAAETDFTLSKGAYLQTDSFINVFVSGVQVAYTEAAGVVTLGSAPALNAKVVIEYDYLD